jgi:hypothetical protein
VLTIPAGSTWLYAIWVQCNVASCLAEGNQFNANQLVGQGASRSFAVYLEADQGVIDSTQLLGNAGVGFTKTSGSSGTVTNTSQTP